MPRKKGVTKVATVIRLIPEAKVLMDKIAGGMGRPANVYVEDLILADARKRGVQLTDEERRQLGE